MNIWEAKYSALCMAIENKEYITDACFLVESAIQLSRETGMPFEIVLHSVLKVTNLIQRKEEPIKSLAEALDSIA